MQFIDQKAAILVFFASSRKLMINQIHFFETFALIMLALKDVPLKLIFVYKVIMFALKDVPLKLIFVYKVIN